MLASGVMEIGVFENAQKAHDNHYHGHQAEIPLCEQSCENHGDLRLNADFAGCVDTVRIPFEMV
jgi:hypothetical protein